MPFFSPFSSITKYVSPDGKGVYVKPSSGFAPGGWGEPRRAEDGTPIIPGTPGGPLPYTLIAERAGVFKATSTKYRQVSGNISWWGPYRDAAKPEKGRFALSYLGPKLRYFREIDFNYGSSPSHNEIYYLGNYAAVAPGPVTGACLRTAPYIDSVTGQTVQGTYIYAAVYRNGQDEFYRKRWDFSIIPPYVMTDELRVAAMRSYDAVQRPFGWQLIGTFARPGDTYFGPETPWFFNEAGTEAAHVRRKRFSFDNGTTEFVEENVMERLVATVNNTSVSVQNIGNAPPMIYTEEITKTHPFFTLPDILGYPHDWQEDHVKVVVNLTGEQFVFGDYIDGVLQWGKIRYEMQRRQVGYYTKGVDPASYDITYLGQTKNISNRNLRVGPRQHNFFEYNYTDTAYVPEEGDHEFTIWIGHQELIRLYVGPAADPERDYIDLHYFNNGTSDEWEGNPRQDTSPYLFFYQFYTRYPRGLFDMRKLAFLSQDQHKYGLYQTVPREASVTHKFKDTLYTAANTSGADYTAVNQSSFAYVDYGWPVADVDTWAQTIFVTLTRETYEGKWPDDNHAAEIQVPGNKTFYYLQSNDDIRKSWPTIDELLHGAANQCLGNGVITDQGTICFSVEVPSVENPGVTVLVSDHKPAGAPASIVGFGDKFYPVGSC